MAVAAERRSDLEVGMAAGARERGVELLRQSRVEEAVVLRIHPEHRHSRALAEGAKGLDQTFRVTDLIVLRRPAAAGEADAGEEARRRIGSKGDGGEAAGRNANGDHARGIDVLPVRNEIERQLEVSGAGDSGSDVVGIVAASETLSPATVRIAIAAPHDDGSGPAAAGKFERLR